LEENVSSIFRVEEEAKEEISVKQVESRATWKMTQPTLLLLLQV
jgi:hypothetical protein